MLSRGMIWEMIQGHYVGNMIYGDELCSLEYIYMKINANTHSFGWDMLNDYQTHYIPNFLRTVIYIKFVSLSN